MIQRSEGHNHLFFGNQARKGGHSRLPCHIAHPSQRIKDPGSCLSDSRKQRHAVVPHWAEHAVHKTVALKKPKQNGAEQNHRERASDIIQPPFSGGSKYISDRRQMIGRKLQHKGRWFSGEPAEFFQNDSGEQHRPEAHEKHGNGNQRRISENRSGE